MKRDYMKSVMRNGKKEALILAAALFVFAGTSAFAVHAETTAATSATYAIHANNGLDGWHKPNPQQQHVLAQDLAKKLGLDAKSVESLFQQGYHPIDVAMAGVLAQNTHKSLTDVLALKKINNNWHDVAASIGVDDSTFKADLQKIRTVLAEERNHHRQQPNPNPSPTPNA